MAEIRCELPTRGTDWNTLRERLEALGENDADWRSARTAVYVFNAGEDVLQVAKDAYALYQSENALGPVAFPSLKRMEDEVVGMGLSLLHAPPGARGNITSGGTESILLAVKTCRDEARSRGVDTAGAELVIPLSAASRLRQGRPLSRPPHRAGPGGRRFPRRRRGDGRGRSRPAR